MRIGNFDTADRLLGDADSKRLPGEATQLVELDEETIAVRYHEVDVITFHGDGRVVLRHGGWTTATTVSRLNSYGPSHVETTRQGERFYSRINGAPWFEWTGEAIVVSDNQIAQL